ncbi:MAG: molybdopterin-dependent oxidoreductase [Actinobacteria bacterium]|nr:molybdopterin-dependent oxidoreductase [Actinomycetota bacterium]
MERQQEKREAVDDQERARQMRVSRKWFLASLGGVAAALVGLQRLFVAGSGSSPTGGRGVQRLKAGGLFPVRTVDDVPDETLEQWVIEVDGMVATPLRIDHAAWSALPRFEVTVDFPCVEGWTVQDVPWAGVRPMELISRAGPAPAATHAIFHAYDGPYVDCLPLEQLQEPHSILADTLDGDRLPPDHGGPVRLVVPSQLAYKSVRFVRRIELTDGMVEGYWEERGYPADAPVTVRGGTGSGVGS